MKNGESGEGKCVKSNNKRQRRKKLVYGLQIAWIVSAIAATIVLLVAGNRLLGIDKASEAISQGKVNANETEDTVYGQETDTEAAENDSSMDESVSGETDSNEGQPDLEGETLSEENASSTEIEKSEETTSGEQTENTEVVEENIEAENQISKEDQSERVQEILAKNNIDVNKPMVALTFDDGPYPKVTNRILQVLSDNGGRATFFVMGNRMESYGDTVEKAYALGNQIGNHTYSHKDLAKISIDELKYEVEHSSELIYEHAQEDEIVLRPPYGSRNETVSENLTVPMIAWSLDTEDWKSRDAQSVIKNVLSTIKDGDIILMHDLYESTAEAVEYLVPELIKQGYQLVTVDELFAAKGYTLEAAKVYYNNRIK